MGKREIYYRWREKPAGPQALVPKTKAVNVAVSSGACCYAALAPTQRYTDGVLQGS